MIVFYRYGIERDDSISQYAIGERDPDCGFQILHNDILSFWQSRAPIISLGKGGFLLSIPYTQPEESMHTTINGKNQTYPSIVN